MRRLLPAVLAAAMLVACGGAAAGPTTTPAPTGDADVVIRSGALEFDTNSLSSPADTGFTMLYVNEGPLPHNVAIYVDESASEPIFIGEIIETGQVAYEAPALPAGSYFFRCDLHPEMNGQLTAQ